MKRSPAFQFYTDDWLGSTNIMLMTPAQEGAYIRLLAIEWNDKDCSLPDDDEKLAVLSRLGKGWFKGGSEAIRKCFFEKNGKLYNKRLLIERKKQKEWSRKSKKGGEKSAELQWGSLSDKQKRSKRLSEARKKGTHTIQEWEILQIVCENKCVKCGADKNNLYGKELVRDHIIPIYQGGSDSIENIQPMCKNCNSGKHSDITDYRPKEWKKGLTKLLTNHKPTPDPPSPSSLPSTKETKNIYIPIFNHWNSHKLIVHKKLTDSMKYKIKTALKDRGEIDIIEAINNYATVFKSSDHYWSHKWTLDDFLKRGLDKFSEEADPFMNYLTGNKKKIKQQTDKYADIPPEKWCYRCASYDERDDEAENITVPVCTFGNKEKVIEEPLHGCKDWKETE